MLTRSRWHSSKISAATRADFASNTLCIRGFEGATFSTGSNFCTLEIGAARSPSNPSSVEYNLLYTFSSARVQKAAAARRKLRRLRCDFLPALVAASHLAGKTNGKNRARLRPGTNVLHKLSAYAATAPRKGFSLIATRSPPFK